MLLGELTYRLVRDDVEVEEVEPLELKGKSERVPRLPAASRVRETPACGRRRAATPLVGRDEELAELLATTLDERGRRRAGRGS